MLSAGVIPLITAQQFAVRCFRTPKEATAMKKAHTGDCGRREFLKRGGIAVVGITCFGVGRQGADAEITPSPEDPPTVHNMLVVGQDTVFLSHLPMFQGMNLTKTAFTSPHRYQVILQGTFTQGGKNVQDVY